MKYIQTMELGQSKKMVKWSMLTAVWSKTAKITHYYKEICLTLAHQFYLQIKWHCDNETTNKVSGFIGFHSMTHCVIGPLFQAIPLWNLQQYCCLSGHWLIQNMTWICHCVWSICYTLEQQSKKLSTQKAQSIQESNQVGVQYLECSFCPLFLEYKFFYYSVSGSWIFTILAWFDKRSKNQLLGYLAWQWLLKLLLVHNKH